MTLIATTPIVVTAATVALALCGVALIMAFVRLVIGPSLPDRVVALELIATAAVGNIACYDLVTDQPVLLDAATVVALVAFLGTVAFARYVALRGKDDA